ncbi:hypothetical protein AQJ27_34775 [Streptomyces olivochromogenes]|nr:hypothetical protein AQJ27_34775 [Streptomyces olivochromogenes]
MLAHPGVEPLRQPVHEIQRVGVPQRRPHGGVPNGTQVPNGTPAERVPLPNGASLSAQGLGVT